jgi:hypothetical protein
MSQPLDYASPAGNEVWPLVKRAMVFWICLALAVAFRWALYGATLMGGPRYLAFDTPGAPMWATLLHETPWWVLLTLGLFRQLPMWVRILGKADMQAAAAVCLPDYLLAHLYLFSMLFFVYD